MFDRGVYHLIFLTAASVKLRNNVQYFVLDGNRVQRTWLLSLFQNASHIVQVPALIVL